MYLQQHQPNLLRAPLVPHGESFKNVPLPARAQGEFGCPCRHAHMHVMQCDAMQRTHPSIIPTQKVCGLVKRVDRYTQGDGFKHFHRLEREIHQSQKPGCLIRSPEGRAKAPDLAVSSAPGSRIRYSLFNVAFL
jgi:hypothetical protein